MTTREKLCWLGINHKWDYYTIPSDYYGFFPERQCKECGLKSHPMMEAGCSGLWCGENGSEPIETIIFFIPWVIAGIVIAVRC